MSVVQVARGDGPVVLGMPHGGTDVPPEVLARLNERGRELTDADWHIERLYDGLLPDATTVAATFHRYVIDANRPPDGASLYPDRATTELVPLTDFDGAAIWDVEPEPEDVADRLARFHAPYHAALEAEMERVRALHGVAVLWDCHSIRSRIPRLFEGVLPDLNVGTNDGATCAREIEEAARRSAASSPYKAVLNGRFKGGWSTRHYGRPGEGWHAIQMEVAQSAYLAAEAAPWSVDGFKASRLRRWLKEMLEAVSEAAGDLGDP